MAEEKKTEKAAEAKAEALAQAVVAPAAATAPVAPAPAPLPSRLDTLRGRAEVMGVPFLPSDTEEILQARLKEAVEGKAEISPSTASDNDLRQKIYNDAMVLVRCRIVCMNPQKADLPGEIFTVSNRFLGEVKRYIPYSEQPDGWHVEKIILDMLKEKQFQQVRVKKGANNQQLPDTRWVREFAIEELPPLTQEELKVLANKQAAEAGMAII